MKTKFKEFLNEDYIKKSDIEQKLLDMIETHERKDEIIGGDDPYHQIHNQLLKNNKEYIVLFERWNKLVGDINDYYRRKITATYKKYGVEKTRELFYEIKKSLLRNERYEMGTLVNMFDLTDFTRRLINK